MSSRGALPTLGWFYTAGFPGIFLTCHTPGFTDADGQLATLALIIGTVRPGEPRVVARG
jgi:hypothetical protein